MWAQGLPVLHHSYRSLPKALRPWGAYGPLQVCPSTPTCHFTAGETEPEERVELVQGHT